MKMDNEKKLERIHTRVSTEGKEWLTEYMKATQSRSIGEAIDKLVIQAKSQNQNQLLGEILSEEIATRVVAELKEPIDILRRRTGYSDRQTKVLTEVLNHMVNTLQLDRMKNEVVTTNLAKTNVMVVAEERVKEQLDHFAQQAATKKAQRQLENVKANE